MPIHPNTRRCIHIKLDKKQCGAPALTAQPYCRFHADLATRRRELKLPMLQSSTDIQQAITEVIGALLEGRIDRSRANSILYGLQLAQNGLCLSKQLVHLKPSEDDRNFIPKLIEDRQALEEFERDQEATEEQLAKQQTSAPSLSPSVGDRVGDSAAHHWTDDIPNDEYGYPKPTRQQQERLDRIAMGQEKLEPVND